MFHGLSSNPALSLRESPETQSVIKPPVRESAKNRDITVRIGGSIVKLCVNKFLTKHEKIYSGPLSLKVMD
jgi:hypothetical protein